MLQEQIVFCCCSNTLKSWNYFVCCVDETNDHVHVVYCQMSSEAKLCGPWLLRVEISCNYGWIVLSFLLLNIPLIKHNASVKKLYKRCALIWMVHSSFFLNISWLLLFCVIQASHRNDSVASRFDLLYVEEFFILQHSVVANENSSPLELHCLLLVVRPLSILLGFYLSNFLIANNVLLGSIFACIPLSWCGTLKKNLSLVLCLWASLKKNLSLVILFWGRLKKNLSLVMLFWVMCKLNYY